MPRPDQILLVGETNPYGIAPRFALYHLPRYASGDRLREHLGLTDASYHQLTKVNLTVGRWKLTNARQKAGILRASNAFEVIVMLGAKVRSAFWSDLDFFKASDGHPQMVSLPHPSGLNRIWNAPGARTRARELMHSVAPEIKWGETGMRYWSVDCMTSKGGPAWDDEKKE